MMSNEYEPIGISIPDTGSESGSRGLDFSLLMSTLETLAQQLSKIYSSYSGSCPVPLYNLPAGVTGGGISFSRRVPGPPTLQLWGPGWTLNIRGTSCSPPACTPTPAPPTPGPTGEPTLLELPSGFLNGSVSRPIW